MSGTDADPYSFAEDLGPQPQATPDGANPLEEGLGALSLFRGLFDAPSRGAYLPGLETLGLGLGFEGNRERASSP